MGGVGADRQRSVHAAECVFDDDVVAVGGEQNTDGGAIVVLGTAQQVIHGVDVEVEFAQVFACGVARVEGKKVQVVGVGDELGGQFGVRRGKAAAKVRM